jgi:hypothetical protein
MLHFYDGQIRRYLLQTIRVFSNFSVKYADGTLVQIPVVYGDADRQAAAIMRQNSENVINSAPRISIYISGLSMDVSRLSDASYVGKIHVRERDIDTETGHYNTNQGNNYTVERLMPTPFTLSMKVDIWSANTDQKLQILEQILVLFNPTLELQTTDNYVDWTSLSVLEIKDLTWSGRTIPVGNDSPIDIATITLSAPIWINPPVKVKQMGIITAIITSINNGSNPPDPTSIDGLGVDPSSSGNGTTSGDGSGNMGDVLSTVDVAVGGYGVQVYGGQAKLLSVHEAVAANAHAIGIAEKLGAPINWRSLLDQYPGKYRAGYSKIYLKQPNKHEVSGTFSINPLDESLITVNWDQDTYPSNTDLHASGPRPSPGTFDAIIDPMTKGPGHGLALPSAGTRYLIVENIGASVALGDPVTNEDGPDAWKNNDGSDFVAKENDIIEWQGDHWIVIFEAITNQNPAHPIYQTNIYTGVQYKWDGLAWTKSFEGEYREGSWRLRL